MKETELDELTHEVIGCALEVQKAMGNRFHKEIYKSCLAIELTSFGIDFVQDHEMDVYYNETVAGTIDVDFLIEGKLIVDVKTIEKLDDTHRNHAIHICKANKIADGLIINFGAFPLECKKVYSKL